MAGVREKVRMYYSYECCPICRKLKRDWWKTKLCTSCVSPLGRILSRGGICPQCGLRVCKNCRSEQSTSGNSTAPTWVCVLCSGGMASDELAKGTKSLGRDSRSIRRSWTISNPQRAQTNSPVLKSYTMLYPEETNMNSEQQQSSNMNLSSSRQFHSLPRMSSGSERSKKIKRSFNSDFEKENIKRHRSFQTTLHPYLPQNPPSPTASINFIEETFWDYYDYEVESSSPTLVRSIEPQVQSQNGLCSSEIIQVVPVRADSNRSSCERSLGETMDYDCSLRLNFASHSDTDLNDSSKYQGQRESEHGTPPKIVKSRKNNSSDEVNTIYSITPIGITINSNRNNIHENHPNMQNQHPVKPERRNKNKRSVSLNSYDGKKLFSPLRTYCVLMKENVMPRSNHSAIIINNNPSHHPPPNSYSSLPRERYIKIEREDVRFAKPLKSALKQERISEFDRKNEELLRKSAEILRSPSKNTTKVTVNCSPSHASGNSMDSCISSVTQPKIVRSQSHREISSGSSAPHYVNKPVNLFSHSQPPQQHAPISSLSFQSINSNQEIKSQNSTSNSNSANTNSSLQKQFVNSQLDNSNFVIENYFKSQSQVEGRNEFPYSNINDFHAFQFQQQQNFDSQAKKTSTFPRVKQSKDNLSYTQQNFKDLDAYFKPCANPSGNNKEECQSHPSTERIVPIVLTTTNVCGSATLPHPYIRRNKGVRQIPVENSSSENVTINPLEIPPRKPMGTLSQIELEIEKDIFYQKTKSLDRNRQGKSKLSVNNNILGNANNSFSSTFVDNPESGARGAPIASPRLKRMARLAGNPNAHAQTQVQSPNSSATPKINAETTGSGPLTNYANVPTSVTTTSVGTRASKANPDTLQQNPLHASKCLAAEPIKQDIEHETTKMNSLRQSQNQQHFLSTSSPVNTNANTNTVVVAPTSLVSGSTPKETLIKIEREIIDSSRTTISSSTNTNTSSKTATTPSAKCSYVVAVGSKSDKKIVAEHTNTNTKLQLASTSPLSLNQQQQSSPPQSQYEAAGHHSIINESLSNLESVNVSIQPKAYNNSNQSHNTISNSNMISNSKAGDNMNVNEMEMERGTQNHSQNHNQSLNSANTTSTTKSRQHLVTNSISSPIPKYNRKRQGRNKRGDKKYLSQAHAQSHTQHHQQQCITTNKLVKPTHPPAALIQPELEPDVLPIQNKEQDQHTKVEVSATICASHSFIPDNVVDRSGNLTSPGPTTIINANTCTDGPPTSSTSSSPPQNPGSVSVPDKVEPEAAENKEKVPPAVPIKRQRSRKGVISKNSGAGSGVGVEQEKVHVEITSVENKISPKKVHFLSGKSKKNRSAHKNKSKMDSPDLQDSIPYSLGLSSDQITPSSSSSSSSSSYMTNLQESYDFYHQHDISHEKENEEDGENKKSYGQDEIRCEKILDSDCFSEDDGFDADEEEDLVFKSFEEDEEDDEDEEDGGCDFVYYSASSVSSKGRSASSKIIAPHHHYHQNVEHYKENKVAYGNGVVGGRNLHLQQSVELGKKEKGMKRLGIKGTYDEEQEQEHVAGLTPELCSSRKDRGSSGKEKSGGGGVVGGGGAGAVVVGLGVRLSSVEQQTASKGMGKQVVVRGNNGNTENTQERTGEEYRTGIALAYGTRKCYDDDEGVATSLLLLHNTDTLSNSTSTSTSVYNSNCSRTTSTAASRLSDLSQCASKSIEIEEQSEQQQQQQKSHKQQQQEQQHSSSVTNIGSTIAISAGSKSKELEKSVEWNKSSKNQSSVKNVNSHCQSSVEEQVEGIEKAKASASVESNSELVLPTITTTANTNTTTTTNNAQTAKTNYSSECSCLLIEQYGASVTSTRETCAACVGRDSSSISQINPLFANKSRSREDFPPVLGLQEENAEEGGKVGSQQLELGRQQQQCISKVANSSTHSSENRVGHNKLLLPFNSRHNSAPSATDYNNYNCNEYKYDSDSFSSTNTNAAPSTTSTKYSYHHQQEQNSEIVNNSGADSSNVNVGMCSQPNEGKYKSRILVNSGSSSSSGSGSSSSANNSPVILPRRNYNNNNAPSSFSSPSVRGSNGGSNSNSQTATPTGSLKKRNVTTVEISGDVGIVTNNGNTFMSGAGKNSGKNTFHSHQEYLNSYHQQYNTSGLAPLPSSSDSWYSKRKFSDGDDDGDGLENFLLQNDHDELEILSGASTTFETDAGSSVSHNGSGSGGKSSESEDNWQSESTSTVIFRDRLLNTNNTQSEPGCASINNNLGADVCAISIDTITINESGNNSVYGTSQIHSDEDVATNLSYANNEHSVKSSNDKDCDIDIGITNRDNSNSSNVNLTVPENSELNPLPDIDSNSNESESSDDIGKSNETLTEIQPQCHNQISSNSVGEGGDEISEMVQDNLHEEEEDHRRGHLKSYHHRRESPEGQEQEAAQSSEKSSSSTNSTAKEEKDIDDLIMEEAHEKRTISKNKIAQNVLNQIIQSRSSPDGADAEKSEDTEPDSPTPMESFDVTSDEDSWVEEILFEDDEEPSSLEANKKHPPPLDLTLHTIVEESCEESEAENSGNFEQPNQSSQRNTHPHSSTDNELEKYFNFGIYNDTNSQGRGSFANEDSEFSDTFSESSFSIHEGEEIEGGPVDPADLASSRLEKYFFNLGLPQSMMNPINTINQTADSDSVGSESESDNSLLENRKKVLKHHRRSADFDEEFGDKISDEEEEFGFGQDGFDTIKKTARKVKRAGSEGNLLDSPSNSSSTTTAATTSANANESNNANAQTSPGDNTNSNESSAGGSSSLDCHTPTQKLKAGEKVKPEIKVNRSNSFTWSSDEEVNIMMSKLRQLIKSLVKTKSESGSTNISSGNSSNKDKDTQLVYLENELIRLMKTDNLKNIVEYLSSEESDVDDVYKFIKVVNEKGSGHGDLGDLAHLDMDDNDLFENLQTTIQLERNSPNSPKSSPALLAKVMHHIGNRLAVWMKDENIQDDDTNDDNVTLKCAPSVSSDLNEDRFSWKGSFESALAAKRQSVGSTDSISSSDFCQDRSILRSSSLHHLANSQPIEENKEEEEPTSLPRMTNLCNSLPRLNQPTNPAISRAHSLVMSGKNEGETGPVKSARYRPPGFQQFQPGKSKRIDSEDKTTSQSTPVLTQDPANLRTRSDSLASIFHDSKSQINIRGQVEFGLQYNYKLACLEVRVKQCRDLAAVDSKRNRSDPYVKAYLLPDKSKGGKRKTKTKKNTLNPIFEETLKFPLTLSDLQNRTLWLSVWHSDIFGKNEFLGEVLVSLKDRVFDDPNAEWWDLQEMSGQMEDMPRGDVIIALKWQPKTESTGNLSILVKEAKNLVPAKNGSPSTFIKCTMLADKSRKQKTSICRRTLNPVWNQTLTFEEVDDEGIEITLWNYDLLSNHDLIGTVRLDFDNPLWESMISRHSFWVEGGLRLN